MIRWLELGIECKRAGLIPAEEILCGTPASAGGQMGDPRQNRSSRALRLNKHRQGDAAISHRWRP